MSSVSISFSPLASSRPNKPNRKNNSQNPKPQFVTKSKPKPKSKSRNSNERISSTSSIAVEATTYTRLPPRDEFLASSLVDAYREIKLSDSSIVPKLEEDERVRTDQLKNGEKLSGFDYEKYEIPDIVDEFEDEDEDDDFEEEYDLYEEDDDDDYVEGEGEGEIAVFGGEGFDEEEEEEEKEKGVPAVMRCFDKAKIYVKAGNGGNGVVAFRREKYVPLGGPSGGDGGRGGNVYVEVDGAMNSLLPFRNCVHFRAGRGAHGQGRNQQGAKGEDVVVKIAPGTVIREARDDGVEGKVLLELLHSGQRALLLPGGRGGRGNAAFKSGMNKVPRIAENGEEGPEM